MVLEILVGEKMQHDDEIELDNSIQKIKRVMLPLETETQTKSEKLMVLEILVGEKMQHDDEIELDNPTF